MKLLYTTAFLLCAVGIFTLLHMSPIQFFNGIQQRFERITAGRNVSMKRKIRQTVRRKRIRGIRKILLDSKNVLELTRRKDRLPFYTAASITLFIAGIFLSYLLGNIFLMPVLAVGLSLLPWLSILMNAVSFQRQLNEELETALSMITTSYLRTDNILEAVRESVNSIHYHIRDIFEKFLVQADMISADIPRLLEDMKLQLNNEVFHAWVDQIILCLSNRTLKSTLQPIVSRLSSMRDISGKLSNLMYGSVKEFISMLILSVLNFPLIALMNPQWFHYLTDRPTGQILVAVSFLVMFISLVACISKTRPIEYGGE